MTYQHLDMVWMTNCDCRIVVIMRLLLLNDCYVIDDAGGDAHAI